VLINPLLLDRYQQGLQAIQSLETKAIGTLQLAALVGAGLFFVLSPSEAVSPNRLSVVLGLVAAALLIIGAWASAKAIDVSPRTIVGMEETMRSDTNGTAELFAASEANDRTSVVTANWVSAGRADVLRAGLVVIIAFVLEVV
jgi:hypothetical protein